VGLQLGATLMRLNDLEELLRCIAFYMARFAEANEDYRVIHIISSLRGL